MDFAPLSSPTKLLQAQTLLETLEERLEQLTENPVYPEASALLASLFKRLVQTARLALTDLESTLVSSLRARALKASELRVSVEATPAGRSFGLETELLRSTIDILNTKIRTADAQVNHIIRYFQDLVARLRYIESSALQHAPFSLVKYLAKFSMETFPTHYVFVRRQWKPNFKFGEFISELSSEESTPHQLRRIFRDVRFKIAMVSIPAIAQDNYLLSCLVAHEIGHVYNDQNPFEEVYEAGGYGGSEEPEVLTTQAAAWEQEFLADVYGTLLLGPAYALALVEFLRPRYEVDKYFLEDETLLYPSLRMRLQFVFGVLKTRDIGVLPRLYELEGADETGFLREGTQRLKALERVAEEVSTASDTSARALWDILSARKENVIAHAVGALTRNGAEVENAFTGERLDEKTIAHAGEKLRAFVPINERRRQEEGGEGLTAPVDAALIINCGWFAYCGLQAKYFDEPVKAITACRNLIKVLKRSVDAAEFHRSFEEHRMLVGEQ